MLLATGALVEFGRFVQILLWIILPVFISTSFITYYFHRKKRSRKEETPSEIFADPSSMKDKLIFFDHTGVMTEYQQQLSLNHARYTALRHDYEKLRGQYDAVCAELDKRKQIDKEVETIIPREHSHSSELRSVRDLLEDSKSQIAFLHAQIVGQSEEIELLTAQKKALLQELKNVGQFNIHNA